MTRLLGFAVFASIIALAFPSAFERYRASLSAASEAERLDPPAKVVEASLPVPNGRVLRLRADPDGHFRAEARFDGRVEPVLVDTGATYVALSERTARRLGITVSPDKFTAVSETANGRVPVALATAKRIAIGSVEVRDVDVMVLKGEALSSTLLGMSFLKRLKSYSVTGDTLTLTP
ncbi:TIGR02281 family clan AA aspartic protease [Aureimonas sp. AU20]|uniref:retropepsin-like aspartic protease family protein n=1 Tax=Aureimonas sp. AU20 TaxID=1349819 RepID=UPI000722A1C3|nr:TIGR02281 family clan AA aspartic protease [Aureimonas sp. AU20]ALN71946.1 hypothetical protein M673_04415 [Aureimonas sp. AU20]